MKKLLFKSLFVASLLLSIKTINAQCSLDQVGAVNFVTTSQLSDVAIAPNKVVYTIAFNTSTGKYQLYSGMTASSWTLTATLTGSTTIKPAIHINKTGKVSIFVRDDNAGGVGKVYYLSGAVLLQQGAAISTGAVTNLCITSDPAGDEYIAYTDVPGGTKSFVKKWNSGSSVWTSIGGSASPGASAYNSLIVTGSDMPVLAFQDGAQANKTSVVKFNGSVWVSIGILGGNATNSKLKLASNGDFFCGYTETGGNCVVQRFNGTVWNPVGSPIANISSASAFGLELDPIDVPYVTAILSTPPYPVAYKNTGVPTWSNVIGTGNLNGATSLNPNIVIDYTGTPYFFYVDQPANNALNVKTLTSALSISTQPISVSRCNGQSGSFNVGVAGGAALGYQWQTASAGTFTNAGTPYLNGTTNTLSFTAATAMNQNNVRCIVNAGCKNIISNTAILTVISPSVSLITTNPTCFGGNDGMIVSTPSGGTGPYTYSWSPGSQNTSSITGQYAGNYTVLSIDINGCSASAMGTLTNPPSINSTFTGNQTICNGANTTLTVTASNGVPVYTYSWSPATGLSSTTSSVVTANPSSTQTYNVQITDANGCVATNTVMITVNAAPTVSAGSDMTICSGGIATLAASGTANTYTWNPGNMVGAIQNVMPALTNNYTVVGTNTVTGCTKSDVMTVFVNALPVANAGPTRTLTCINTSTTLSGSGGGTYSWSGPGIVSGGATATPLINMPGTYNLLVTVSGCTSTPSSVIVSQNTVAPSPSASSSGPLTCINNSVTLTGMPATGVTYAWSGPGITGSTTTQTTSANVPGIYTLSVVSAINGCTNSALVTITQNTTAPSPTASNTGTLDCITTTVGLNGTPASGVTYLWTGPGISGSTTTQTTTANAPGTYTLKVTSATNGCTNTAITSITQNTTVPSSSASTTGTLTCTTLTVALNGGPAGMTYLWSGPGISGSSTSQNTAANAPGIYSITITNPINGCIATSTTVVSQNVTPPTASATNSSTLTCTVTSANLFGTGGGTYNWSGPGIASGGTSASPVINAPGCYNLTVTNVSNGCTATASTCVSQNTIAPAINTNVSGTLNCTLTSVNASATTTATPVTYNWSGAGITSASNISAITVNASGIKNYTVTNTSNGCYTSGTVSVSQNTASPVGLSAGPNQTLTCASPSVTLNGSISSPTNSAISWSGGVCGSTNTLVTSACSPGIYTLTATDIANGCLSTSTVQVNASVGVPLINVNPTGTISCSNPSLTISITTTSSPVSFLWAGPGIISGTSANSVDVNQPGTYTVTVTNTITGCFSSANLSVSQDIIPPTVSVSNSATLTCLTPTVVITGIGGGTYSWSGSGIVSGGTTASAIINQPGTYFLTVTAANGCTNTAFVNVMANFVSPSLSVSGVTTICKGSSTNLTVSGATSYTWGTGSNSPMITVTPTVTTTYSVTGSIGSCSSSVTTTVSIISSKNISGVITSTTGATTGDVILYKYVSALSQWDSVTTVPFAGSYSFAGIDSALYVVRAIPTATNIQVTYGDSAISWQDATVINHGCANNSLQNIKLIALENFIIGPGVLTGTITEGNGFVQRMNTSFKTMAPGNPIGGIIVKGGKNPGGQMLVQTITDEVTGTYTLSGLPLNTGSESYFIYVDIPGLDTNGTYHVVVSSGNTQFNNLNFYVDSMYIHPNTVTFIQTENILLENKIIVYPNPAQQFTSIQYELLQPTDVSIDLHDVVGNKIESILLNGQQEKNKYTHRINTSSLSSGVYLINLKINNSQTVIKLIVTE